MHTKLKIEYVTDAKQIAHIAESVKRKRKHHQLTQKELAHSVGISQTQLSTIELGNLHRVNKAHIRKLAMALHTETRELIGRPPRQNHTHQESEYHVTVNPSFADDILRDEDMEAAISAKQGNANLLRGYNKLLSENSDLKTYRRLLAWALVGMAILLVAVAL